MTEHGKISSQPIKIFHESDLSVYQDMSVAVHEN